MSKWCKESVSSSTRHQFQFLQLNSYLKARGIFQPNIEIEISAMQVQGDSRLSVGMDYLPSHTQMGLLNKHSFLRSLSLGTIFLKTASDLMP